VEIEILGNGGGLGLGEPTTSIRVGNEVLLDAGSGLETLSMEQIRRIRRVYLTHAHADHLSALPLLVETLFECGPEEGVQVLGLPETLSALRAHLFNGEIWPDFTNIPESGNGFLRLVALQPGRSVKDPAGFTVEPFRTAHEIPSCGYALNLPSGKRMVFTGDTGFTTDLVESLDQLGRIEILVTECSYPNRDSEKGLRFGHLTPGFVAKILEGLRVPPAEVWLGHFKPHSRAEIQAELEGTAFFVPPPGYRRTL